MSKESDQAKHVDLAADIVSAYVAKNAFLSPNCLR